ncbi:MAG TPA: bifunctional precorrin-2 dehydrogenase/sirohydrochlorin ferrochelatase [Thermoanaerobaculia bacterium]|nr:bifunctional precorrin-2 dehydrogenase/sirohydrochlorin ferrochelatase [Thermoanaerobaculia bacterium]
MKRFPHYPIFIDVEDRDVVIVGGGDVCARKADTMLRYGARVTVVAPDFSPDIEAHAAADRLKIRRKRWEEDDLEGAVLVIASTDDPEVNTKIAAHCRRLRIPVNVVDVPELCEFIVPAIVDQGSIHLAISTEGKSPALARTIREELQQRIGPEYAELNELLGSLREAAKRTLPTDTDRKRFFDGILATGVLPMMREGRRSEAIEAIATACQAAGVEVSEMVRRAMARG